MNEQICRGGAGLGVVVFRFLKGREWTLTEQVSRNTVVSLHVCQTWYMTQDTKHRFNSLFKKSPAIKSMK